MTLFISQHSKQDHLRSTTARIAKRVKEKGDKKYLKSPAMPPLLCQSRQRKAKKWIRRILTVEFAASQYTSTSQTPETLQKVTEWFATRRITIFPLPDFGSGFAIALGSAHALDQQPLEKFQRRGHHKILMLCSTVPEQANRSDALHWSNLVPDFAPKSKVENHSDKTR